MPSLQSVSIVPVGLTKYREGLYPLEPFMEEDAKAVIDQVEKKEEKLKQVRQFMNYYLPTTIKLLEQYVQLQNVGLKGENISTAMQQIEQMLDKVIVAFQKQLDSLFEADVVDITADIQVMEQMMASQGLTDKKDF